MKMSEKIDVIGKVQSVDTGNVTIIVEKEELLNSVQINQIVTIDSTKVNEQIIGLITKIMRKASSDKIDEGDVEVPIENVIKVVLVGTLIERSGTDKNIFKRTLNTVPSINAECHLLQDEELSKFMNIISSNSPNPLTIGKYTISENSNANLDGNKFFQRHAVIVGGTGSGKSWTVANVLEKASKLESINCIVFDLHGEYEPLKDFGNVSLLRIAGPSDSASNENAVFLPYWLLSYEEMEALLLDRSDSNAPNQARTLFDLIITEKKKTLEAVKDSEVLNNFTIESPVPYSM